jgi:prepilin-type N-terminal cleavage/methylation domain-containing protein
MKEKKKAFTMVEIVITMVVISVIAAWGIPSYQRTLDRTRIQSAMASMKLLHSANMIYMSRHEGEAFCQDHSGGAAVPVCGIQEINNMNGANSLSINFPSMFNRVQCLSFYDSGAGFMRSYCQVEVVTGNPMDPPLLQVSVNFRCPLSETPLAACEGMANPYCFDGGRKQCP